MTDLFDPQRPDSPSFDHAVQQAIACHRNGRLDEAERGYRALLRAQPTHAEVNHHLGLLLLQAKQPGAALPLLRTALETNPRYGPYWLGYIDALIQAGQHDAARAMLAQGRQRGLQGDAVAALVLRLQADELPGPGQQALGELATLFSQSRFAEMERAARDLTTRFPEMGAGWKALGTALAMQGRADEALLPIEKAAALLPGDVEAQINLGNVLHALGRLADAEHGYRRAIETDPRNAEAHRHLGVTLCDLGQLALAEESCRRALALKPDSAEASSNLARVLHAQGRIGEAEERYRQSVQMRPAFAEAHYDLATLLNEQYRFGEAEGAFRRALALKPDYPPAQHRLGRSP